ncbi:MAG: curli production assembly/transport protein CsgE [Pseudomonadales bacterium]|nr:curli production assembly/transport protein CsgE [Pseudomonadales bacterium]
MHTLRMTALKYLVSALIMLGVSSVSFAENNPAKQQDALSGLVINQTSSYLAQTFYQAFCLAWHEHKESDKYNITLKESHSARGGRQVQIMFSHKVAYVASLPSGKIDVKGIASSAASFTINRVQQMAFQDLALSNPDMAVDEI